MAWRTNGHVLFTNPQYAGACMREERFSEGSIRIVAAAGQLHINPAVACNWSSCGRRALHMSFRTLLEGLRHILQVKCWCKV